jgi:type IV pilus assembly protein PilY1
VLFRLITAFRAALMAVLLTSTPLHAQSPFIEQFTGSTTNNSWYFYDGACLTAGTNSAVHNPGQIPGCKSLAVSYYQKQVNSDQALVGGSRGFLGSSSAPAAPTLVVPDPAGSGALRFTNGAPYGMSEDGAIISADTFPSAQGLQLTFKTVTYRGQTVQYGDGVGSANDGADGIGFFLMDGATSLTRYPGVGALGGSLGYSCSNKNFDTNLRTAGLVRGFDGLVGAYLGLGVDEFGNFLNGTSNTLGLSSNPALVPDNTASGGGYFPNAIGLRGGGNVSWAALRDAYGNNPLDSRRPYYPASLASQCPPGTGTYDAAKGYCAQCSVGTYNAGRHGCDIAAATLTANPPYSSLAVRDTCANGLLYNYSNPARPSPAGAATLTNSANTAKILDYAAIGGTPLSSLGAGNLIANESALTRAQATAITYRLRITSNNLLSLAFSYNGGAYQPVIADRNLVTSIGPVPQAVRFGFVGATGGSTNIHEMLCFEATPDSASSSSAGANPLENPVLNPGTQLFLAYYDPQTETGRVTAQGVGFNTATNLVSINPIPTWDASCVLTGVSATTGPCSTGATSLPALAPASRAILTWNGSQGVAFEWSNLTPDQRTALSTGDLSPAGQDRLAYLRGDRGREINTSGAGLFRRRGGLLGDIIDSSPTWVGPPQTYASSVTWVDRLYPDAPVPEGGRSYAAFQAQQQARLNVVYVGANDGFLHGFRAGGLASNGALINTAATPNDGREVLAYLPGATLSSAAWSATTSPTQSVVQNIHGVVPTPAGSGASNLVEPNLDFSSPQYGHNYYVDATPATGDVFFGGQWHTWLVGGLGAGGALLYALDVTNPASFSEQSSAPANVVIGEWTASTLTCVNLSHCGAHLGNTYGTPLIRRFHNGSWGVIFGNGYGTLGADAGIYIMLINPASGARSFYYLGVPQQTGDNGISSPTSLDLDSDHIVDYVYAGDLLGNVWRFDVTSSDPMHWAVSAHSPLFRAGRPITTALAVGTRRTVTAEATYAGLNFSNAPVRVIVNFGTGRQIPQTATAAVQYATGPQYLYGIWDWDMGAWNTLSPGQQALSLPASQSIAAPPSGSDLQQQTIITNTNTTPATRSVSKLPVCWKGGDNCNLGQQSQFGWFLALPASSATNTAADALPLTNGEQILFDPQLTGDGELVVNTYIPALDSPLLCNPPPPTGFTMAVEPDSGAESPTAYFSVGGQAVSGVQNNGVGAPLELTSGSPADNNAEYLITQTSSGRAAPPVLINRHTIVIGQRLNWIQRR